MVRMKRKRREINQTRAQVVQEVIEKQKRNKMVKKLRVAHQVVIKKKISYSKQRRKIN